MNNQIINYIKYLKETSKYFVVPGNMYRCLIPATLKNQKEFPLHVNTKNFEYTANNDLKLTNQSLLSGIFSIVKNDSEKQLFLGFGSIMGKSNKKNFGCIFYCPVTLTEEGVLTFNINDVMLNMDLFTSILPAYVSFEDFFESENLLKIFQDTEDKIRDPHNNISLEELINYFIDLINKEYKELNIVPYNNNDSFENIIYNRKHTALESTTLQYSHEFFLFINKVPSNISSYKALTEFCSLLDKEQFNHEVLEYLFKNIFTKTDPLNTYLVDENKLNNTIRSIPFDLTEKQKVGLKNSFQYPISYIQGPPGTGKSHTISAIVLAAYLLKKKVLVVSQKNTALQVVKNNLLKYFSEDLSVPFIYFEKDNKHRLKEELVNLFENFKVNNGNYNSLKYKIDQAEKDILSIEDRLDDYIGNINQILNQMNYFYVNNTNFQKNKNIFFSNPIYKVKENKNLKKLVVIPEKTLTFIKNIEIKYLDKRRINKYDLFIIDKTQSEINEKFDLNINLFSFVKKGLAYTFLKDLFIINNTYYELETEKSKIEDLHDQLINYRYKKDTHFEKLKEYTASFFKNSHSYNLFESLNKKDNFVEVENFKKLLHWSKSDTIINKMETIDYDKILSVYPIWLSEIRNIGEVLPLQKEIFDLIIVDEASQVNLAEILPVFYRGKHVCIVGDHCQLGINSVGTNFMLSKKSDGLIWDKFLGKDITYNEGKEKNLLITNSSILEMMISESNNSSFPSIMLDEHWRCLPGLISFSNKKYYNSNLKIMTEVPDKILSTVCSGIKVEGTKNTKVNEVEAKKVIEIIRYIIDGNNPDLEQQIPLNDFVLKQKNDEILTIGVISLLRDQVDLINDLIKNTFTEETINKFSILCGTAEDFQGEERDIIIHSFVSDKDSRNTGHYGDNKRFNVAVSRAKYYNIVVYTDVSRIPIYREYLQHMGVLELDNDNHHKSGWTFDFDKMDSIFEQNVYYTLLDEIEKIQPKNQKPVVFYNQVNSLGYKLDFVLYNPNNKKSVVLEVDGRYHFQTGTNEYTEHHKERIDILKKAGWNIINTADYSWYYKGYFDLEYHKTQKEVKRIMDLIRDYLKI